MTTTDPIGASGHRPETGARTDSHPDPSGATVLPDPNPTQPKPSRRRTDEWPHRLEHYAKRVLVPLAGVFLLACDSLTDGHVEASLAAVYLSMMGLGLPAVVDGIRRSR